nr:MAG TPA: ATPase [Caudoviricetes sp.]
MFLVDILIYILSIIFCFFAIILSTVMFVTIKTWLEKNKKENKRWKQ